MSDKRPLKKHRPASSRRVFLKTAARIAAAAGLGLLGFSLFKKSFFAPGKNKNACTGRWICRNCGQVSSCAYPEALSYRNAGRKG